MYVIIAKTNIETPKITRDDSFILVIQLPEGSTEDYSPDDIEKAWVLSNKGGSWKKTKVDTMYPVTYFNHVPFSEPVFYPCSDKVIRFIEK